MTDSGEPHSGEPHSARPFTALAAVYDDIMADVEYDLWAEFVLRLATARGYSGGPALDLGCGTGNSTAPLVARGIPVEGLDASPDMLVVARRKLPGVPFHDGDFEGFSLGRSFDLVYSLFDSLNNLLTEEAFLAACRNVHRHLAPGGIFAFDANTDLAMRELWAGGRVEGWADDVYYSWRHEYDEATGLAYVEAYCSTPEGSFVERHAERGYDARTLTRLLEAAGFAEIEVVMYPDGEPAGDDADRVWAVAVRP